MRKSFTRLSSLLVLLLLSFQMVLAVPKLITTGSGGLSPTDGGIVNPNTPVFTMTFQANVQPGLLQIIGLYNNSGTETKAIQLRADQRTTTADSVYFTHPDGVVTFKGKVVKIKFTGVNWSSLQNQTFWITIGPSAIQDASGNFDVTTVFDGGAYLDKWDFTVQDLTAPTVKALYPKDEAVDVPTAYGPFAMKFKETVRFVNGASYTPVLGDFALYRSVDAAQPTPEEGGDLQSLLTPTIRCFLGGNPTPVTWGNPFDSLTITWFNPNLPDNTALYVRVKPGIIEDLSDNVYAGINNEELWDFHTKDDRFIAPVITSQSHAGCVDSIWSDGNFYATFESGEVLYYTSGTLIPNGADLKAFITIVDQNGVNIPIRTALYNSSTNQITIDPENVLVSSGLSFTVSFAANKIIDASGNLNKANSRKFVAGNWNAPTVISQRITNQSGTTMDFLIKTNEPCAIHYIVVRKDPAFDPTVNEIFGHATYPGAATVVNNTTNDDKFYRIHHDYVATPAITPALVPEGTVGNGQNYYGKQTAVDKWQMVEIFAEGNISVPAANYEVLKRISGLPATHGITDSPAAYYEIWYELIDTLCTQGAYATSYWAKNNSALEHISAVQVMDGSTVFTTDILMPEAWFDADSAKVAGDNLPNKGQLTPPNVAGTCLGQLAHDGKIYINFNEPVRKNDGNEFSAVAATQNTELKACLFVHEGSLGNIDRNSDVPWNALTSYGYHAALANGNKQIVITPDSSWASSDTVYVKIKNSKIEDQRGNEIVPYGNLYTQRYKVESYIPPLVRYTKGTIFDELDSAINVHYKTNHNTVVEPITVTVSGKIYVFPGALLETGIVPAGTLVPFVNDTTKLSYIGNFFKIRKGTGSTVTESFGDPLERKDFTFTIDYTYGDSTKILITPKKQYDSEIWYFVQIDGRIQDQNLRTIAQGAAVDNNSDRPKVFKLADALTGNATLGGWVRGSSATDDNQTCVFKSEDSRNPELTFFTKKQSNVGSIPAGLVNINGRTDIALADTIGVYIDEYVSLGFDHYIHWDALNARYTLDANAMRRYFKVFDYDSVAMQFDVVGPVTILNETSGDRVMFYIDPYYVNADGTRKANTESSNFTKCKKYWVYFNSQDADDHGLEANWGKDKGVYWDSNANMVLDKWASFTSACDVIPGCVQATITPAPSAANLVASSIGYISIGLPYAANLPLPCIEITEGTSSVTTISGQLMPGNSNIVRYPVSFHSDSSYIVHMGAGTGCGSITINSGNAAADQWPLEDCIAHTGADSIWNYTMVDETAPALDTLDYGTTAYSSYLIPQDDECGFDKRNDIVMVFTEEVLLVPNKRLTIYDSNNDTKAIVYAQQCRYGKQPAPNQTKDDKHVIIVPHETFGGSLNYLTNYHINIDNGFVTDMSYMKNKWAGIWVADLNASCTPQSDGLNDWSFRTGSDPAPYFAEFSPANGTATVSTFTITFSEEVYANAGQIVVNEVTAGPTFTPVATFLVTNTSMIRKIAPLKWEIHGFTPVYGKQYAMTIPQGAFIDAAGQQLIVGCSTATVVFDNTLPIEDQTVEGTASWYVNFRDAIAPYVLNNWPRNGAKHVPYNAYLYIEFNEPVNLSDGSAIIPDPNLILDHLKDFIQIPVLGSNFELEFVGNNKRLIRVTPMDPLGVNYNATAQNPTMQACTSYSVQVLNAIPGYAICDSYGNLMSGASTPFTFTTEDITAPVISAPTVNVDACTNKFNFHYNAVESCSDTLRLYYAVLPATAATPSAAAIFAQNVAGAVKQGVVGGKQTGGVNFTVDMGDYTENPSFKLYAVARDCEVDIWTPSSAAWDSLFFFDPAKGYGEGYDRITDIMPAPNYNYSVVATNSFMIWDNDAPTIKGSWPVSTQVQFPINDNIRFWFSEKVEAGVGLPSAITLRRYDNNIAIAATVTWPTVGPGVAHPDSTFIIDPASPLEQETKYYIEFDRYAIQDTQNVCPSNSVYYPQMVGRGFWFVTQDNLAPRLKDHSPATNETCVSCPDLNADGTDFITINYYDANEVQANTSAADPFIYLYRADVTIVPRVAWSVVPASEITVTKDALVDTLWHVKIPVHHQYYPNDPIQVVVPNDVIKDIYGNKSAGFSWIYTTCNTESPKVDWAVHSLSAHFNYSADPTEAGIFGKWNLGYRSGTQGDPNSNPTQMPTHIALKLDFGEQVAFNTSGTNWEPLSTFDFDGTNSPTVLVPSELMSILKVGDLLYNTTVATSDYDTIVVTPTSVLLTFKYGTHAKLPVYKLLAEADSIDGGGLPYLEDYYMASLVSNKSYPVTVTANKVRAINNCVDNQSPRYVQPDIVTIQTRDDTPPTVDFKNAAGQSICETNVCIGKRDPITISFSDSIVKSSYDVSWLGEESYTFDNLPLTKDDLRYPIGAMTSHYFEMWKVNKATATRFDRVGTDPIPVDAISLGSDLMNYVVQPKNDLVSEGWYELVFKKFTVKKYIDSDPSGTIYEGGDTCRFFVGDYVAPAVSWVSPANGSTNVGSDTKEIKVVLNENVKLGTTSGLTRIRRQDGSIFAEFTTAQTTLVNKNKTDARDTVIFNVAELENFIKYYVEMPVGFITDDNTICDPNPFAGFTAKLGSDGLLMSADWSFMTSDSTPPELIAVAGSSTERSPEALFPKVGSTVATNSDLVMIFDENIGITNTIFRGITIYHDNGDPGSFGNAVEFIPWSNFYSPFADKKISISGSNEYDGLTANVITINPATVFDKKGVYYVRVNGIDITDGNGNLWSESVNAQLDPVKDREWYFSIVNDAAPVLVATTPSYDGVNAARTYNSIPADPHGFVKTDLSMTFKDAIGGDPIDVAPGGTTRKVRIFEYTYDAASAQFKSKPWIALPINDPSISFVGNVVTIHDVVLRDGINGKGASLATDSCYYVTVDPGAIVNGLDAAQTWWQGIANGFVWRFQTGSDDTFVAEPTIISPLNGAKDLTIDQANNLVVDFGEGIEKLANPAGKVQVFKVGVAAPVEEVTVTKAMISGKRLDVPLANIVDETNYYVQIQAGAFGDTSTVSTPNTEFGGPDVWGFQTGDNTPPDAVTKTPSAGCVEAATALIMTFNESRGVVKGTGNLEVKDPEGTIIAQVAAENITISEDGNTVTALVEGLPDTTLLTVTVPAGFINDKGNNVLPNPVITWTFKTGENTAPTVVITPDEVSTPDTVLTLTFSETVAAVGGKTITINDVAVDVDSLDSADGKVYTLPLTGLSSETTYTVVVEEGAFIDVNDGCVPNVLAKTTDTFVVGDIVAPVATGSPKTASDYVGLKLAINFTEAVTPATGNIVIYDAATDLAIETIPVVTSETPVTVYNFESKNVRFGQYYILIDAGAFVDLAAAPIAQACPGISSKTVWPLAIVDPSFDGCIDITSMKPARAEKNVPTTTAVVITFCTERLAPGVGVVTIGDQSTNRVLGVNYFEYPVTSEMINGSTLTIPVTGLQENTTYSIIIPYGAITDEAGNPFIGITDANAWLFTTGDFTDPVVSVDAVTVLNDGTGAPVAITSSEAGIVYLAKDDVAANATALLSAISQNKAVAATLVAPGSVNVSVEGLVAGTYKAYGFDASGRMGTAANVVTVTAIVPLPYSTIKQIQGQVATSPLAGQKVRTKGVVTVKLANGFYMQDANAEWGGIFVSTTSAVSEGSSVEVIGTVSEVDGLTTIGAVEGLTFIAPVITVSPLTVAPNKVIEEAYEGVKVKVTGRAAESGSAADWTITTTASSVYAINNAVYGSFTAKKDYKYAVTGIGIPAGAAYKVLAIEIEDISTRDGIENLANSIKVYPNPFDKFITLSVSNDVVVTKAVITNIAGQLVKEVINPSKIITTSELRSGVYFISLHTVDGIAKTERIIKR